MTDTIVVTGTQLPPTSLFLGLPRVGVTIPMIDQVMATLPNLSASQLAEAQDKANVDVNVSPLVPMTPELQAAIDLLKAYMAEALASSFLTSDKVAFDGMVTTRELKTLMDRLDFVINPDGTQYANGSFRGEADFNNGDPVVRLNADTLKQYANLAGGMGYLIGHELGHMTALGLMLNAAGNVYNSEQFANDFSRAFNLALGQPLMAQNPGYGYNNATEQFVSPALSSTFLDETNYVTTRFAMVSPDGIPYYVTEYQ